MESFMRLKRSNNSLILDLIGEEINPVEFDVHLRSIKALKNFQKLYVNIEYLADINNDMINKFLKMNAYLRDKIISFINVNPLQNAVLNMFNLDKKFQIYMNKADALEGKKPVVNRKFRVV